ncbi:ferric reductase like transmembrane component-domain-containing protein [Gymnopilus junonius]|uniref:Ferric reductase like transmembrane component-domain-containing protein n=1 Tax=Gymnopilus junonius TaxID=109634 RepID=A0A9P5TL46_GYMJU|nr:ferric reductase like transmembrane component-domain-containing protein [Gymnopilus junonius]
MADTGVPPVIPVELQQYNSYVVDPQWQRKFSTIWPPVLGFFILLSLPHLVRSIRNGRAYSTLLGISEDLSGVDYTAVTVPSAKKAGNKRRTSQSLVRRTENVLGTLGSFFYWTLPGLGLNAGQMIILMAYAAVVVVCIVKDAPLMSNSNRAGFIALAQFPIVFLFATKNSIVSLLLGPGNGYEKLNFIHRWSGRALFFGGLLHGALWIQNHLEYNIPILSQQKEASGVAAFAVLCVIVLTSLRPVRRFCYEVFFIIHFLTFIAFFVTICYHTIYASPWIFPPLAFYGLDILMRMFRHRIKDAVLVPVGNQMTLVHVPYSTSGWIAGQHVRLRVFFRGRVFESHPLSIFSATPDISCITSMPQGLSFGVRAIGDWSKALNQYAVDSAAELQEACEKDDIHEEKRSTPAEIPVQVMLDGPYGGCSVDLGNHETALLFAGGSGITFTLGVLDDIGGAMRETRAEEWGNHEEDRIRLVCSIDWFAPALMDIANAAALSSASENPLELHISIYVTCLCNPEAVPPIPNCDVTVVRPSIYRVLMDLTTPPNAAKLDSRPALTDISSDLEVELEKEDALKSKLSWVEDGGGLAVCASGPEGLVREASNAVARMKLSGRAHRLGGIGLHTEIFTL